MTGRSLRVGVRLAFALFFTLATGEAIGQVQYRAAAQASLQGAAQFVASTTATGGASSTSVTVNRPSGVTANDVLIAQITRRTTASAGMSAPAGWTLLSSHDQGVLRQAVYYRVAGSAEPTSYTWSWTGGSHVAAGIAAFRYVDTANPVDVHGVSSGYSATATFPTLSTTAAHTMLVALLGSAEGTAANHGTPTGMTLRYSVGTGSGSAGATASGSTAYRGTTGSTGTITAALTGGARDWIAHLIALRGAPLTISRPAGTVANDALVAAIAFRNCSATSGGACTATVTPPSGWTPVGSVDQTTGAGTGGFGNRFFVYRRIAGATEPSSYSWQFGETPAHTGAVGAILAFYDVDLASLVDAWDVLPTPSATTHTAPSVTTTVPGTMLVTGHALASSGLWTPPTGMTERADVASLAVPNSAGISMEVNTEPRPTGGPTGTRTASVSAPADPGTTFSLALRPAGPLHHYAISFPGGATAVTCDPHLVTVSAHNASHASVSPPAGTVLSLSTSTASGVWEPALVSGSGTWTPSGANNGAATYVWPGGESSFTVRLRHNTPVTLSVNLVDSGGRTEDATEDPSLSFADAAFRVTDASGTALATFGTHIAGKPSDTGFAAQVRFLQAIRTDTSTGSCVGIFPGKTVSVQLAGERVNPTGGSGQVQIRDSGASYVTVGTGAGAPGPYTNVSLAFDAQSKAPLVFLYPDAGRIRLHARYELPAPPAGTYIVGSSNDFVVRPFGLRISGVTTSAAPSPSAPVAYVAGENLINATLTAVAWKPGDDADANGVPDSEAQIATNPATPNFGQEAVPATATLTHTLNAPSGGNPGALGGATLYSGFAGGTKTQAVNWSEVGFINLHATSANYLGSGQNVTNSAAGLTGVGRFRPHRFALATSPAPSLQNRTGRSCTPASSFTYLDEPLGLSFTLQARNAAGVVTQNYAGAYAKLALGTFASYDLGARSGATALTPRVSGLSASGSWSAGSAAVSLSLLVSRAAAPDGPFAPTEFGIAPLDSDNVAMNTYDLDADANGSPERKRIDGVLADLRYGRIRLENANGSELLDLPVPLRLEYWAGAASGWQQNTADSCSALQASDFAFVFPSDPKNNLSACETRAIVSGTPPAQTLVLEKPGAGNQGWTDITLNLGATASGNRCTAIGGAGPAATTANMPYLQYKWTGPADENPKSRATFGVQPSAGPLIYRRERY